MKDQFCSACGQEIKSGEMSVRCRLCMHNYHSSCWEKTGGCITWGCAGRSAASDKDLALTYKKCSCCGEEVLDFAIKCPYCREVLNPEALTVSAKKKEKDHEAINSLGERKDPILTGLLNLIFPGAGYMYLGQFNKGLFWFLIALAAWFFTRGIGLIFVYSWVIYDSSRQALQLNRQMNRGKKTMERS